MKNKLLKYTDYKIQQALWLQRENAKRTNLGTNLEQFCIQSYRCYLYLTGYNDENVFNKMREYEESIDTCDQYRDKERWLLVYKKEIADNINELMDSLID